MTQQSSEGGSHNNLLSVILFDRFLYNNSRLDITICATHHFKYKKRDFFRYCKIEKRGKNIYYNQLFYKKMFFFIKMMIQTTFMMMNHD